MQHTILSQIYAKYGEISQIYCLRNASLDNFVILDKLGSGGFGQVYNGYFRDDQGIHQPVIIKFTQQHEVNDKEYQILKDIEKPDFFPQAFSKGKVIISDPTLRGSNTAPVTTLMQKYENQIWSYIVQQKFGKTLEYYLQKRQNAFSEKTTVQVGLQLLEKLQAVHEEGYIFNDLKPNNILVGNYDDKKLHKIRLIDFGISNKYLDENNNHVKQGSEQQFKGNFIFASVNALKFETVTRRDDLISLCYLLVYLIDGDLPFIIPRNRNLDRREEFDAIKELKENLVPEEFCKSKEASRHLLSFVKAVLELDFDEKPDYNRLRFLLVKGLLDQNVVPDRHYDWCERNIQTSVNSMLDLSNESLWRNLNIVDEFENEMEEQKNGVSQIIPSYIFKQTKNRFKNL